MPTLSTLGAACARAWGFTSGLVKDTYFNLVSLLLPGNGTNGAQNNTFLDSSSNNFTITRNGDTTQGTFSPFSQTGWGAYFDGSNDYVATSANNLSMQFGTGSYTVECWIYQTARNSNGAFFIGGSGSIFQVSINATGYLESSLAGVGSFTASTSTVPLNSWTHIALVRSSTSTNGCTYYINGNASGTYTDSNNHSSSTSTINIGTTNAGSSTYVLSGYISNMRIAKSAYYTSNFTPSITPLTTTSQGATNVTLLSLQNNRFIDNAATPNTLTANNGVAITPFSPFSPTSSYSAAAVGGSGYFDGSGDYLSAGDQTAFEFGAGDFTLEAWVYIDSMNGALSNTIMKKYTGAFPNCEFLFQVSSSGALSLAIDTASTEYFLASANAVVPIKTWVHCVATRSGSTIRLFANGNLVKVGTSSITIVSTTTPLEMGNNLIGYLSGARIFKGSIPTDYQTSSTTEGAQIFTPPTAPPTTTSQGGSSPSLLLNFTNAGVVDATAKNVLETEGNAQIDTSVSKFGGGSIKFDGNGDYLLLPNNSLFGFRTAPFTIEFWFYPTASLSNAGIIDMRSSGASNNGLLIRQGDGSSSGTVIYCWLGNPGSTTAATQTGLNINAWNYIAVVRDSSNDLRVYINGSAGSAVSRSIDLTDTNCLIGGFNGATSSPNAINGYIDDLRITRGVARTVTTSPSGPFPLQ